MSFLCSAKIQNNESKTIYIDALKEAIIHINIFTIDYNKNITKYTLTPTYLKNDIWKFTIKKLSNGYSACRIIIVESSSTLKRSVVIKHGNPPIIPIYQNVNFKENDDIEYYHMDTKGNILSNGKMIEIGGGFYFTRITSSDEFIFCVNDDCNKYSIIEEDVVISSDCKDIEKKLKECETKNSYLTTEIEKYNKENRGYMTEQHISIENGVGYKNASHTNISTTKSISIKNVSHQHIQQNLTKTKINIKKS